MTPLDLALLGLAAAFAAALVRTARGPTRADRAIGADLAFVVLVAALALLAVRLEAAAFLDAVLVATLVGFLASVSLTRLVDRED